MSETFSGTVEILDSASQVTVAINADTGRILAGGKGKDGDLVLLDGAGNEWLRLRGGSSDAIVSVGGVEVLHLSGDRGTISSGGGGRDGELALKDGTGQTKIYLDAGGVIDPVTGLPDSPPAGAIISMEGSAGNIRAGGNGVDGDLILRDSGGQTRISLDGETGTIQADGAIVAGDFGSDGQLVLVSDSGQTRVRVEANASAFLGGNGDYGELVVFPSSGDNQSYEGATAHLDGRQGNLWLGGHDVDGDVVLRSEAGLSRIHLDAGRGTVAIGGHRADGHLALFTAGGDNKTWEQASLRLDGGGGTIVVGGNGIDGDLVLYAASATGADVLDVGKATIHLNGDSGDITLRNADCAEDFEVAETAPIDPGTVMVIDADGRLRPSSEPYDKRVAGVVSGGGDYRPGIVLGRAPEEGRRLPVALVGKVFCKADAQFSSIGVGDLLTTSPRPGHAMKADDRLNAFGAVIGKALAPLDRGQGLIPILVALQ